MARFLPLSETRCGLGWARKGFFYAGSKKSVAPVLNGRLKVEAKARWTEDVVVSRDSVLEVKASLGG